MPVERLVKEPADRFTQTCDQLRDWTQVSVLSVAHWKGDSSVESFDRCPVLALNSWKSDETKPGLPQLLKLTVGRLSSEEEARGVVDRYSLRRNLRENRIPAEGEEM